MSTHHHPVQFEQGPDGEIVVNVPKVRVKVIKNTKGFNYEISVAGDTVEEVRDLTDQADAWLRKHYGSTD